MALGANIAWGYLTPRARTETMASVKEMAELRNELLGGFHVASRGRAIPEEAWQRRKTAALFKLLALTPRHRLHREQVMDALWPELAPAAAAANLRKAVYYARRALPGDEGARVIVAVGELLCLPSEGVWVDVDAFRTAAARARQTADPAAYLGSRRVVSRRLVAG